MAVEALTHEQIRYVFDQLAAGAIYSAISTVIVAEGVDKTWFDALETEFLFEDGKTRALGGIIENGETWKTRYWATLTPAPSGRLPATFDTLGLEEGIIFGSLFIPGCTVTLGDHNCTVLGICSDRILVRVPAHAATTGLTYKVKNPLNDAEAELTGGGNVVAYAKKTPVFTSITPATGKTKGGTRCVIRGTAFTPGMAVTIGGHAQTVLTEDATHITFRTTAHAAGALDVVITARNTDAATGAGAYTYV